MTPARERGPARDPAEPGASLPRAVRREIEAASPPHARTDALRWTERALEARDAGDHERMFRAATRAKAAARRSPLVRELLGISAYALGREREARAELMALRRLTGRRDLDHVIADCLTREGNPDRALELLGDLSATAVPPRAWAFTVASRARAYAAKGKLDLAEGLLRSARVQERGARAIIARALDELTG